MVLAAPQLVVGMAAGACAASHRAQTVLDEATRGLTVAWKKLSVLRSEYKTSGLRLLPPHPHRGCAGKVRYPSREAAQAALTRINSEPQPKQGSQYWKRREWNFREYLCKGCAAWHLGHDKRMSA